jgi:hypothetical protein
MPWRTCRPMEALCAFVLEFPGPDTYLHCKFRVQPFTRQGSVALFIAHEGLCLHHVDFAVITEHLPGP